MIIRICYKIFGWSSVLYRPEGVTTLYMTSSSGRFHWALASPSHQAPVHGDCCPKASESQLNRRRGARHVRVGCHFIRGIRADDSAAGPAVFYLEESRYYRTLSSAKSVIKSK